VGIRLEKITIKDLAVINRADIVLDGGFCVLTGETGAGKSLVVSAIELLLGGRADTNRVRTGSDEANIEGVFEVDGKKINIRRRITASGRSYAYIDDSPVNLKELAARTEKFADLLGQHEHQALLDPASHVVFLDSYAGHADLANSYREDFEIYTNSLSELKRLEKDIERAREQAKLRDFELRELRDAELDPEQYEELSAKLKRIEAAETILEHSNTAREVLTEGENNIQGFLAIAERAIQGLSGIVPESEQVLELLETAFAATAEASDATEKIAQSVEVDHTEADQLRGRQMFIQRLCRKYNRNIEELIEYLAELEKSAVAVEELEDRQDKLRKKLEKLERTLSERAGELTKSRAEAAPSLADDIATSLAPLGMDNVRFTVRFDRKPDPNGPISMDGKNYALLPSGAEEAEFLISPNPGEDIRPLATIVSGGELSRIMLALKSLIMTEEPTGILVFDEVDTGIGGDVGHAVGEALCKLAQHQQLLVVTHLPQIARRAQTHFVVDKFEEGGRTKVNIRKVTGEEREKEFARMHGSTGSPTTMIR